MKSVTVLGALVIIVSFSQSSDAANSTGVATINELRHRITSILDDLTIYQSNLYTFVKLQRRFNEQQLIEMVHKRVNTTLSKLLKKCNDYAGNRSHSAMNEHSNENQTTPGENSEKKVSNCYTSAEKILKDKTETLNSHVCDRADFFGVHAVIIHTKHIEGSGKHLIDELDAIYNNCSSPEHKVFKTCVNRYIRAARKQIKELEKLSTLVKNYGEKVRHSTDNVKCVGSMAMDLLNNDIQHVYDTALKCLDHE